VGTLTPESRQQLGVQGDFGVQDLGDGAACLGAIGDGEKFLLINAGDLGDSVTAKPPAVLSRVMVAVTLMVSGVNPALPSSAEKAMAKQPEWAAPISSSGLVPMPFSKRVLKEYCVSRRTPLSVEMAPLPSFKLPCQMADALRFIFSFFEAEREFVSRTAK
jgi:hypothetical protein